jgi:hypothetical protein
MRTAGLLHFTRARVIVELVVVMAILLLLAPLLHAQAISPPTKLTPYDWQCQDASGTRLTDHTGDFIYALIACWNNRAGDRLVGGAYKLPTRTWPNRAPTLTGLPPAAVEAGKPYSYTPTAADGDGDPLSFTITNRPAWAAFDPATGALTGTPALANVGIYSSVRVSVSDGKVITSTSLFSITVTAPPAPPLTAPTLSAAVVVPHPTIATRFNVNLTWTAVAGADAYEVRRCVGATCTQMFLLASVTTGLTYTNNNLPENFTYRYDVRGKRGPSEVGPASNAVTAVTKVDTPPPPPGQAVLQWTPPTKNTNGTTLTDLVGYRVHYGTSASALSRKLTLANAALTTYTVEDLTPGTWYFALQALGGDPRCVPEGADCVVAASVMSNVATKVVQ